MAFLHEGRRRTLWKWTRLSRRETGESAGRRGRVNKCGAGFVSPAGVPKGTVAAAGAAGAGEPGRSRPGETNGAGAPRAAPGRRTGLAPGLLGLAPGWSRTGLPGWASASSPPVRDPPSLPGLRRAEPARQRCAPPALTLWHRTANAGLRGPAPRAAAHHRSPLPCPSSLPLPAAQSEQTRRRLPVQHLRNTFYLHGISSGHCTLYTDIFPLQQGRSCAR